MKRFTLLFAALMLFIGFNASADERISVNQLPEPAQAFIKAHFADQQVAKVERDRNILGHEYDVTFTSGAEVDFNKDGAWTDVKAANGNSVPAAIVPAGISKYVSANYKSCKIKEISVKRSGYEVELSNGVDLIFNANGKFVRVDR